MDFPVGFPGQPPRGALGGTGQDADSQLSRLGVFYESPEVLQDLGPMGPPVGGVQLRPRF